MTGADNLAMLARGIGGLVVVLVLIALLARFARRRGGKGDGTGLRVVERLGLSREANLAVVEVSNRTLLLGVTAQGVTMLANLGTCDQATDADLADRADLADLADRADLADLAAQPASATRGGEFADAEVRPAPAPVAALELDLTGLERDIAQPRSASPVGTDRRVVRETIAAVPNGLALDDYPDLASALRAAGRTTGGTTGSGTTPRAATASSTTSADVRSSSTQPPAAPRTRAEARAQGALTSSSGARTRKSKQKPGELKITRIDDAATANPSPAVAGRRATAGRTATTTAAATTAATTRTPTARTRAGNVPAGNGPAGGRVQASGSVLSPRTWRQGVDALRELTVRRG